MKDLPPVTLAGGGAGPEASSGGGGMLTQIQILTLPANPCAATFLSLSFPIFMMGMITVTCLFRLPRR